MYASMYVCMCACVYVSMYVCMYACMYLFEYVCNRYPMLMNVVVNEMEALFNIDTKFQSCCVRFLLRTANRTVFVAITVVVAMEVGARLCASACAVHGCMHMWIRHANVYLDTAC